MGSLSGINHPNNQMKKQFGVGSSSAVGKRWDKTRLQSLHGPQSVTHWAATGEGEGREGEEKKRGGEEKEGGGGTVENIGRRCKG